MRLPPTMLRLSRLTDYAIVLAIALAGPRREGATARALADDTGIPRPTVTKLLKLLTASGVVQSTLGRRGGYALARPPENIDVVELIETLEGEFALTVCCQTGGTCSLQKHCLGQGHWPLINRAVRRSLQRIRLADLTATRPTGQLSSKLDRVSQGAVRRFV